MKAHFWHERWETGQLGFHQAEINALLLQHWPRLAVPNGAPVFVPLCGKSLDMHWLREQGHPVVGIELSSIAIRDFFEEAGIAAQTHSHGALRRSSGSGYELFCGDFFDLARRDLAQVRACYDRASLIALPPEIRVRYAEMLIELLPEEAAILLITLEYDQAKMTGPPHSVAPSEVEALFGADYAIELLESRGPVPASPRFIERGLDVSTEHVLLLTRTSVA